MMVCVTVFTKQYILLLASLQNLILSWETSEEVITKQYGFTSSKIDSFKQPVDGIWTKHVDINIFY